ncbi:tpr domain protein in aerotolerance operon batb [Anaeramoeba flamelloides]|uniref:Tpr domain protein in aerotolerance operon batb n=1 Tax=Anaeramoeba flamelloides TaxID=1746091 RepID=A0AAV7ZHQ1_9EUKA|nr:tpr domain protein in aerotolerance operon batb [Anaeramoeba flamelloides]
MINLFQVDSLQEEKNVLLNNFRQETGSSLNDALSYLNICNWDYQFSVGILGLLELKNSSRINSSFKRINESVVEMNEFFGSQSSEGEGVDLKELTQRKRSFETVCKEKNRSPKERKTLLTFQLQKQVQVQEQEQEQKQEQKHEQDQDQEQKQDQEQDQDQKPNDDGNKGKTKENEEEKHQKLNKLQSVLSQGFLNWDKRLRAMIEFDPELIVGYPDHLKTKSQITIKKTIFDLLTKYTSKKVSKKNLQRGVHSFLAKYGFKNETRHNHNIMIFRSQI